MKNFLFPVLMFSFLLLFGCASHSVKTVFPPAPNRLELLKSGAEKPKDESEEIAKLYINGLKAEETSDKSKACNFFTELASKNNFPLKDASVFHVLKNCDLNSSALETIWLDNNISNYLKENYYSLSKELAFKNNLPQFEARFSYELIPYVKNQYEKLKLIKRLLYLAEQSGNKEDFKKYQDIQTEIAPRFNTEINDQNIFMVAKDFENNREFKEARELYKKIINGNLAISLKVKAYNSYRISYKVERDLKTFLEKTKEMEHFLKNERDKNPSEDTNIIWVESVLQLTRAIWTDHRNSDARKMLDNLIATKLGNNSQKATMQWLYASLYLENKEQEKALLKFTEASKIKTNDLSLQENIQWGIVWNNYLLKKYDDVIKNVDKYIAKSNNAFFTAKLNFWKGKAFAKLNNNDEAKLIFSNLYSSDQFGYYGILAAMELQIPLTPLVKAETPYVLSDNPTLDWMMAIGEKLYSQKYLKELDSKFKTINEREKAMSLYFQTEWYQGGMRQIYSFPASTKMAMTAKYINVVFPTPYQESITNFSNMYEVPSELIFAITRQESAFSPNERSWADAFGLMQLIPEKAHELSRKYDIVYNDFNDLYDPETNLEMGTALLSDLTHKFKGKFAQTVASYNASEAVIKVWEQERFNGNYIEFIEMIPYEETRNYIKTVFRNYITYKRLTSTQDFLLSKDFFTKQF